jgi:hypothetical protein
MAEETVVSGNVVRLPLDISVWQDAIVWLAREGYKRRDRSSEVAAAGYSRIIEVNSNGKCFFLSHNVVEFEKQADADKRRCRIPC